MRGAARLFAWAAAPVLALGLMVEASMAQMLEYSDLDGWQDDDHRAALSVFLDTCSLLNDPDWAPICRVAPDAMASQAAARSFFEMLFRPVMIGEGPALFTGYYEPELAGSPIRTPRYPYPIYARPPELQDGQQWLDRGAIETSGALRGRGLEIAWLEDPVEVFFLQIQGSGRVRFADGRVVRVGYAGRNGHPYRSVGKELIRRGILGAHDASAQGIKAWCGATLCWGRNCCGTIHPLCFSAACLIWQPIKGRLARWGGRLPRCAVWRWTRPIRCWVRLFGWKSRGTPRCAA